jgi:hypothetical protein
MNCTGCNLILLIWEFTAIEAIHLAASRVNCFYVRHVYWSFWLSVVGWKCFFFFSIKSGFWESTCYFFIVLCVSVNCYISCLVCVAICVSRSHSLYLKKNVFPCCLLFPNLQRIGPREERGEEESMGPPFSYFPFHLNQIF